MESAESSPALLASDTTAEAERVQIELWREMSPRAKLRAVAETSAAARDLSLAGIRRRYPGASDEERRLRYALITLGHLLACAAYPEAQHLIER